MNDYMTDLCNYISEHTSSLRDDEEYQQAVKAYLELETEVKQKIGNDLLTRYQRAEENLLRREKAAFLTQTLRFGHHFMMAILR